MKWFFIVFVLFTSLKSIAQNDSAQNYFIELTILLKDSNGKVIPSQEIKILRSDSINHQTTTDSLGQIEINKTSNPNFLIVGYDYEITLLNSSQYPLSVDYRLMENKFTTKNIDQNTKIVLELHTMKACSKMETPGITIFGLLTTIDSSTQSVLDYYYALLIENPTMIISIKSLFEHQKDITPFWNRSKIIQARLIEMGIPVERLQINIAKYSEMDDEEIRTRKKGNVIFEVISFDYKPSDN